MRVWLLFIIFGSLNFLFGNHSLLCQQIDTTITTNNERILQEQPSLAKKTDVDLTKKQALSPKKVWKRSAIIPGWGQLTNKQAWKIPIVYGLLGGLVYTTRLQTIKYHDYRAAFYNLNNSDLRYGETPAFLSNQTNGNFLRNVRDNTRQQRDQLALGLLLAYGLNIIDSYVYAHFRTFDVSDDLTLNTFSVQESPNGPYYAFQLKLKF